MVRYVAVEESLALGPTTGSISGARRALLRPSPGASRAVRRTWTCTRCHVLGRNSLFFLPRGRPWVAQRCSRVWEGNKLENHSRPSLPGPWRSANLCSEMMGGLQHHADYLPSPSGSRTGPFCAITWHFLTCVSQPYHLCPTMDEYRYLASVGRERGRGRALELAAHTSNICPLRRPK